MSHNPSSTFCHINFFLKQRKPARVCVSVSECVIVCCLNQSSWWPSGPEGSGRSSGGGMEGWRWNKAEGGCDLVGSRRRGGGRFEVVGGQETRLIHPLSPPQAHTRFFLFEKSLSLLLVFPSALTGFLRLPVYFLLSQESGLRWRWR